MKQNIKKKKIDTKQNPPTHWGEVGAWYDDLVQDKGSEYHQEVIFPALLPLISKSDGNIKDLNVVDLGCGQGVLTRQLAALGANCTGIDLAPSLISMAKKRGSEGKPIQYIKADITDLLSNNNNLKYDLKQNHFDVATIILTIQNIDKMRSLFKAVNKLLKVDGSVYIVMVHPAFRIPKSSDWYFNEKLNKQARVMYQYLSNQKIEITMHPGQAESAVTYHFHRPLKSYLNALSMEKLYPTFVDELITHKKEQKGIKSEQIEAAKAEFPMFMLIKATKLK
jgi:2-polyprenyl-3-methyl-5-hydroxy-6-metoxy-1,4-benzoquinol methylase